ncbi:hypothetical protein ASPWEDRAFT_22249 [Aspergillus wentii DTO 134E9]|uniref:Zn(2)-C6 fungal-type domain-containing protein n=1 Tax=Aspergillus wentii DTO 134E9 TaxID=1073089 RepID=A0A1L9RYN2_ASPWE|nr:uncharacterized protein ASPWEDRAFT_22249 [Aspergillus wentii DTO 134E9]KAI9932472.1 hypothetical protein MW887_008713 [Aspergillus wentii]OJJ40039.1 hypothetical protein ASPWEDRAFT_22249 [Aspergillus wentii DTO 134E9]
MDETNSVIATTSSISTTRRQRKRRSKVTRACDACKLKKKACTGNVPCAPCLRFNTACTYNSSYSRGAALPPPSSHQNHSPYVPTTPLDSPVHQTPLSILRPSDSPSPQVSQEPNPVTDVVGQYCGPASTHSFLGRAVQKFSNTSRHSITTQPDVDASTSPSIFSHGDRRVPAVDQSLFHWPDIMIARDLVRRYFEFASPTYRILHQATVDSWVDAFYSQESPSCPLPAATQSALLMVFATAVMFRVDSNGRLRDADEEGWRHSEIYFTMAEQRLSYEAGAPTLRSVQSRFLMVLYFLCSSRANRAWFTFGTMVQLMMCLGLHRKQSVSEWATPDHIVLECQKRIFWCAYTLDKYLSLILGRPRLLQDEDVDQELPTAVNDDDLKAMESRPQPTKDCVMNAPILHSLLSRILARAAKEQYALHSMGDAQQIEAIRSLSEDITEWKNRLPPILSGAIQPSSLIPIFRRQLTVLQLALFHATMFVTRPLLLRNYAKDLPECEGLYQHYLTACVMAARNTVQLILSFVKDDQLFPSFWYSQYIAFNALSAIYIYFIQVKRGRIPACSSWSSLDLDKGTLYELAETTQQHLAQATVRNAPSWRYSAILEGLRCEVNRVLDSESDDHQPSSSRAQSTRNNETMAEEMLSPHIPGPEYGAQKMDIALPEFNFPDTRAESLFESFALDNDPSLNFWPQLDCLPFIPI